MRVDQVVVKPVGAACSMACSYCYYQARPGGVPRPGRMTEAVLEQVLSSALQGHEGPELGFVWHGGEPTLAGLDFYERVVALQARLAPPGVRVRNAVQTNGLSLDDRWGAFLAEHAFDVGVSLDGPLALHDARRRDHGGLGTASRVLGGIEVLRRHGVEPSLLAAVDAVTARHPRAVYDFLTGEAGGRFLQFIPVVRRTADGVDARSVDGPAWGRFLSALFDRWLEGDVGTVFVQLFDAILGRVLGLRAAICTLAETCGAVPVVEWDGSVYACDHFVGPEWRRGSVRDGPIGVLLDGPEHRRFGRSKRDRRPARCRSCPWVDRCGAGCLKDRWASGEGLETFYLCDGVEAFHQHSSAVFEAMGRALHAGRAPSEVMVWVALERGRTEPGTVAIGRHEPCPCQSGRKFGRCHGRA